MYLIAIVRCNLLNICMTYRKQSLDKMHFIQNVSKYMNKEKTDLMFKNYPFSPFLINFCTSRTPRLRLFRFGAANTKQKQLT